MKFILIFIMLFAGVLAESKSLNTAPDDNIIVRVANLSDFGKFHLSWGIIKSPDLWIQNKYYSLENFKWPAWDKNQVPLALMPSPGVLTYLKIYDKEGLLIDNIELKNSFVPEQYINKNAKIPAKFQIELQSDDGRILLLSPVQEWVGRKPIFTCDIKFERDEDPRKSKRLNTCLSTLSNLPQTTKDQWYVSIKIPRFGDREINRYLADTNRELRKTYVKNSHVYELEPSEGHTFKAVAGRTFSERALPIAPDNLKVFKDDEYFILPPSKEVLKKTAYESMIASGHKLTIYSFAADEIDQRKYQSPPSFQPGVNVQMISNEGPGIKIDKTEFEEQRTGVVGELRYWQGSVFGTYNQITSNRGEQDTLLNLPGFETAYRSNFYDLNPYLSFESGIIHSGSSLSMTELLVGARRHLGSSKFFFGSIGYDNYALAGRNPGSSRLGRTDALALGLYGQKLSDEQILRGRFHLLVSKVQGFEGQLEYGKIIQNNSDLRYFMGGFLGYSRYAAKLINRTNIEETFTETRIKIGFSLGFVGPEVFMDGN